MAERIAKAQSGTGKYQTTADDCQCPHHRFRGAVCKHMLAIREGDVGKTTDGLSATERDHQRLVEEQKNAFS